MSNVPSSKRINHQSSIILHSSYGLLLRSFTRRTLRTLCAEENLFSVWECQVSAVGSIGSVFRLITIDEDLRSDGKRTLGESPAKQGVRCSAFNHPSRGSSIGILDVNVNPGVRIDQFHFLHSATKLQRLLGVELGGEGVVGHHLNCSGEHCNSGHCQSHRECSSHGCFSFSMLAHRKSPLMGCLRR